MNKQNLEYISNLKIDDVPWDRLSCSYGTAELFAQILNSLAKAVKKSKFDDNALGELLDEIVAQCEYQAHNALCARFSSANLQKRLEPKRARQLNLSHVSLKCFLNLCLEFAKK